MKLKFKGFTLVELIMSMGLLTILIGVMTALFGAIIDTSLDSTATSGVDQDGKYIMARLAYDMQRATSITSPPVPSSTTATSLTLAIDGSSYTYDLDGSANIRLSDGVESNNLNNHSIQVSDLSFQRLGIGNTTDTVQVKFRLTSKINETSGIETKAFQTTIGLK
jgi:type II secretory pathway pseudopilin PulG